MANYNFRMNIQRLNRSVGGRATLFLKPKPYIFIHFDGDPANEGIDVELTKELGTFAVNILRALKSKHLKQRP